MFVYFFCNFYLLCCLEDFGYIFIDRLVKFDFYSNNNENNYYFYLL